MTLHCINYTWKKRSARSSPGSAFFGSPIRQSLPKQHLNLGSPSMGNMLKIATSSSFSFARLILSSPTVFVCRCSLLDSRSLNASVAIFPLNWISLSLSNRYANKRVCIHRPPRSLHETFSNRTFARLFYSALCDECNWIWFAIMI